MFIKLLCLCIVIIPYISYANKESKNTEFKKADVEITLALREFLYGSSTTKISVKTINASTILSENEKEWIKLNYIDHPFCEFNNISKADSTLLLHLLKAKLHQCHSTKLKELSLEKKLDIWKNIPTRLAQELSKKYLNLKKVDTEEIMFLVNSLPLIQNIVGVNNLISESEQRNLPLENDHLKNIHAESIYKQELQGNLSTINSLLSKNEDTMLNEQVSGTLNFYLNNVKLIPSAFASEKLLQTSQQLLVRGHDEIAKTMLTIANMNSSQEHKSDLVFHLLASYLLKNDFNGAKDYIDKNIHLDNVTDERLLFWIAKIFEKNNLNSESEKALRKILEIGVYPTYYDYLAAYSLNINSVKTAIGHTIDHSTLIPKIEINHRLRLWGKFKLEELLEDESISLTINSIEAKDNSTLAAIQTALAEQKKFLMLFKMANILETRNYKEFSISSNFLFPDEFKNTVLKNNRSKLDSMLVMALIRQESAFNKEAKSPVGALGLMQIMPATGKSLDRKTTTTHLKTPEKNIKLGIKYLDHLVKRFNSIPDALAAYNAGPHRVSNWRSNLQRGDDLLLQIELIPFKETRNYIKYIFRNYASYRNSQKNNDIKAITHDFFGSNNI